MRHLRPSATHQVDRRSDNPGRRHRGRKRRRKRRPSERASATSVVKKRVGSLSLVTRRSLSPGLSAPHARRRAQTARSVFRSLPCPSVGERQERESERASERAMLLSLEKCWASLASNGEKKERPHSLSSFTRSPLRRKQREGGGPFRCLSFSAFLSLSLPLSLAPVSSEVCAVVNCTRQTRQERGRERKRANVVGLDF